MSVTLTFPEDMPVKWGTDFNALDPCNPGFTPQYCQAVNITDETPLQVEIAQSGVSQAAVQGDWGAAGNWTINADGTITHAAGATTSIQWSGAFTSGEIYKITLVVTSVTAGTFNCNDVAGAQVSHEFGSVQTEIFIIDTASVNLGITPTSAFDGTIQVTIENINDFNFGDTNKIINGTFASDTSWSKGTGWTIAAGIASKAAGSGSILGQEIHTPTLQSPTNTSIFTGNLYRVEWTVSGRTAGSVFLTGGNGNATLNWGREHDADGTFTDFVIIREQTADITTVIGFDADSSFDGDVDNVIVNELANTQYRIEDCDGISIFTIPDGDIDRVSDTRENVTVDWSDTTSTEILSQRDFTTPTTTSTNTSTAVNKLRDSGAIFLSLGLTADMIVMNNTDSTSARIVSIDSDIQITLDQDIFPAAAGDTYSIWIWKTEQAFASEVLIESGLLSVNGTADPVTIAAQVQADIADTKNYVVEFTISNYVAGTVAPFMGTQVGTPRSANGTFTETITMAGLNNQFTLSYAVTSDMDIDNVSVKLAAIEGCHKICVDTWNGSSFVQISCTECYCVATIHDCTLLFTLTNDENAFGVDYTTASFNWSQRLRARLVNPRYTLDIINNKDNLGVINLLSGEQEKLPHLIGDDWPEYVHDWVSVMLVHDTWTIDAIQYVAEPEDYEPIWRDDQGRLTLSKSRTEVKKSIQKNVNNNG